MSRRTRRDGLRLAAAGIGVALGGCLGRNPGDDETPGDETTPTDGGTPTATPDGDVEFETLQLGTRLARPDWHDHHDVGHLALYASGEAARAGLDLASADDERRAAIESFVADTDFETERLLLVESVGPDTCHDAVEVTGLTVADGVLAGEAAVVADTPENGACGDAVTYPSVLVRVRFPAAPADEARLRVTDGWDEAKELRATAVTDAVDPDTLDGHVRPDSDPTTVPPELVCEDDDFTRHGTGFAGEPPWGATDGHSWGSFALRVDRLSVARGETVTVSLTNLGPGEGATGNRYKYNLQVLTEAGWQDVRGHPDGETRGYTDEAILHEPGEGFEWSFEMTPEGVVVDHVHGDGIEVCPGLPAGRYRFVFWEPTVAVAFDLRE